MYFNEKKSFSNTSLAHFYIPSFVEFVSFEKDNIAYSGTPQISATVPTHTNVAKFLRRSFFARLFLYARIDILKGRHTHLYSLFKPHQPLTYG